MQAGDQLTYELKGVGMIVRKRDSTARVFEQYYDMPNFLNHKGSVKSNMKNMDTINYR